MNKLLALAVLLSFALPAAAEGDDADDSAAPAAEAPAAPEVKPVAVHRAAGAPLAPRARPAAPPAAPEAAPEQAAPGDDSGSAPSIAPSAASQGGAGIGTFGGFQKLSTTGGGGNGGGGGGGGGGGAASGDDGGKVVPKGSGQVGQIGGHKTITAYEGQFVAIPFHTRALKADIAIPWGAIGGRTSWAEATWKATVSDKPGDFNAPALCTTGGGETGIAHNGVNYGAKSFCQLQPNKVYYFNMYCARAVPKTEPCYTSADIWYNEMRPDGTFTQIPNEWAKP